jgi:hypothetical protein
MVRFDRRICNKHGFLRAFDASSLHATHMLLHSLTVRLQHRAAPKIFCPPSQNEGCVCGAPFFLLHNCILEA